MRGHHEPIRSCDRECAAVNRCEIGGLTCERCGLYFCACDLDENGYCQDCAAETQTTGKRYEPISSCDSECAQVNHCEIGGLTCNGCGCFFCASELDVNGFCKDCVAYYF